MFIDFIYKHFESSQHIIILYTNKPFNLDTELFEYENVCDYDKKNVVWLYQQLFKADKIVWHNLSVCVPELFLLSSNLKIIKKSIWVVWGGDLYCYLNKKSSILEKIVEGMRKRVIKNIPVIATLTLGDYELAVKWYKTKAQNVRLDYCDEEEIRILSECAKSITKENETINILVGNSATKSNRHQEVFQLLTKYIDKDIRVYAPISYGDYLYADEVEQIGIELLQEKFVPIKEYMPLQEYYELLSRMDIAIFNMNRQQAIGNITSLAYLGKKIYIRRNTSMWDEFVQKKGYAFHAVESIYDESFESFIKYEENEKNSLYQYAKNYFDVSLRIQEWKRLFELKLH